ncbi:MAG: hypothetical protein ACI4W6_05205 [Acutalibacteraceae bacterium]
MNGDYDYRLKLLSETAVICENEEKIRNLCTDILACTDEKNRFDALSRCRKKLRLLENEKCRKAKELHTKNLDIGKLIESVCLCCDIILASMGKSVKLSTKKIKLSCDPEIIIDAFLNLISNSAKFSFADEITVSVTEKNGGAVITVENDGRIDFDKISRHGGIAAAENASFLHAGRLLFSQTNEKVRAFLQIAPCAICKSDYAVPDFSQFLTDDFSSVHIGLADVEF